MIGQTRCVRLYEKGSQHVSEWPTEWTCHLQVRSCIPDLARCVSSIVNGSSNGAFRSDCARVLRLDGRSDNLAADFEGALTVLLDGFVDRLAHKAVATDRRRQSEQRAGRRRSGVVEEDVDSQAEVFDGDADEQAHDDEVPMETGEEEENGQTIPDRTGTSILDFL